MPEIVERDLLMKACNLETILQAMMYCIAISLGGIVYTYFGGLTVLVITSINFIMAIVLLIYFKSINNNKFVPIVHLNKVTFSDGLQYLKNNTKFTIMIFARGLINFIYGITEIINFKLGFDHFNILILSLVLSFSVTVTIVLYFYKTDQYQYYYLMMIISLICYYFAEKYIILWVWFIATWMFSYVNYAFYILINSKLQQDVDEHYRGRVFSYSYGIKTLLYAAGSFSGSYAYPWYWLIVGICVVMIGGLIVRLKR
jgi:hypothetical protein